MVSQKNFKFLMYLELSMTLLSLLAMVVCIVCQVFQVGATLIFIGVLSSNIILAFLYGKIKIYNNLYKYMLSEVQINRHDYLTKLLNRDNFIKYANKKIKYITPRRTYYIVRFDVDSFSMFNELLSQEEGNKLLKYVADILKESTKPFSGISGRLYNDVFACLIDGDMASIEALIYNINKIKEKYSDKFLLNFTFGIFEINNPITVETCLDCCRYASMKIKEQYTKNYIKCSNELDEEISKQEIMNTMEYALKNNEFQLYIQGKYDSRSNEIIGGEALVRWYHAGKFLYPNSFIPIFEKNGFILNLDWFVYEETIKLIKAQKTMKNKAIPISVNVSKRMLLSDDFKNKLCVLLNTYSVLPSEFELEITETVMASSSECEKVIQELRKAGFKILMDDFGSEYSSLNVLNKLDFDIIKLDMNFFKGEMTLKNEKILECILVLSKKLNLTVIAEGIETKEQVEFLKKYECYYIQGYYYARPVDVLNWRTKTY